MPIQSGLGWPGRATGAGKCKQARCFLPPHSWPPRFSIVYGQTLYPQPSSQIHWECCIPGMDHLFSYSLTRGRKKSGAGVLCGQRSPSWVMPPLPTSITTQAHTLTHSEILSASTKAVSSTVCWGHSSERVLQSLLSFRQSPSDQRNQQGHLRW